MILRHTVQLNLRSGVLPTPATVVRSASGSGIAETGIALPYPSSELDALDRQSKQAHCYANLPQLVLRHLARRERSSLIRSAIESTEPTNPEHRQLALQQVLRTVSGYPDECSMDRHNMRCAYVRTKLPCRPLFR